MHDWCKTLATIMESQNLQRHLREPHLMPCRSNQPDDATRSAVIVASAAYLHAARRVYDQLKRTIPTRHTPLLSAQTAAQLLSLMQHVAQEYACVRRYEDPHPIVTPNLNVALDAFPDTVADSIRLARACQNDAGLAGEEIRNVHPEFVDWTSADLVTLSGYTAMLTHHQNEILTGQNPTLVAGHILAAWAPQQAMKAIINENNYRIGPAAGVATHVRDSALNALARSNSPNLRVKTRNHQPTCRSERFALAYPQGGEPALQQLDRSPSLPIAVAPFPTDTVAVPTVAYRLQGAIYAKFADEPYEHEIDQATLIDHADAIRAWATRNAQPDALYAALLAPICASARD